MCARSGNSVVRVWGLAPWIGRSEQGSDLQGQRSVIRDLASRVCGTPSPGSGIGIRDLGSTIGGLLSGAKHRRAGSCYPGSGTCDLGAGIWDRGPAIWGLGSAIGDLGPGVRGSSMWRPSYGTRYLGSVTLVPRAGRWDVGSGA